MRSVCVFLSTGFGSGLFLSRAAERFRKWGLPAKWTGSGLAGTLIGAGAAALGCPGGRPGVLLTLGITIAAVPVTGAAEEVLGTKDDPAINLDETVGYLWALAGLPLAGLGCWERVGVLAAAFALFRIFDVFKLPAPGVQRLQGGLGIMADDVLAGLLANGCLQAVLRTALKI